MAVAVKNASEAAPHSPLDRLAVSSLLGMLFVLGSIGIIFYAIPALWSSGLHATLEQALNPFFSLALQLLAMGGAALVLGFVGARLAGPHPPQGLRAGVALSILGLLGIAFTTWVFGLILQALFPEGEFWNLLGLSLEGACGIGLLYLGSRTFFRPSFEETLTTVEAQGWFSWKKYKASQGLLIRRGTLVGILALVVCGIATMSFFHNTLDSVGYDTVENGVRMFVNDWVVTIPFTQIQVAVLHSVRFTLPILLFVAGIWFAYRLVNWPTFADFLIATEAEMNKVSWTTRKRLWQDTIVVLTTLILMTLFLMFVDLMWGYVLTRIRILAEPGKGESKTEEVRW
jgi:preprotein translocase SecE subunit